MAAKYAFPRALKELRFHFSQTGEASVPLRLVFYIIIQSFKSLTNIRQFLTRAYPVFKKHNPTTPVLIREAFGVRPTVFARFEFGKESKIHLDGIPEAEIEKALDSLINHK